MMWALLQQRYFGKKVVAAPVATYHDRARAPAGAPDVERIVDDIRGHAKLTVIEDSPQGLAATGGERIEPAAEALDTLCHQVRDRDEPHGCRPARRPNPDFS